MIAVRNLGLAADALAERSVESPKPNVSVERQVQSRNTSMSFSSKTGDTMSPTMSIVSFMRPIQVFCPVSGDGGTISATFPIPWGHFC